jgi:hypothetical protein
VSLSPHPRSAPLDRAYERRRPQETILYRTLQAGLETLVVRARERERPLPRFVEREFRSFLSCGILAQGFLRVHCDDCGHDRLVAFSCKGRGFCPSCGGRRMADTAAHLVDRVIPEVPVRQWVLTVPFALRYRMAYDASLTTAVLREFVRAVFASLRKRARGRGPSRRRRAGAITFIQRFGDALNLNVHFHTLVLDGIYERYGEPGMRFRALPPPTDAEVAEVVARIARRVERVLARRGLGPEPPELDPLVDDQPLLAGLAAASVRGLAGSGRQLTRRGDRVDAEHLSDPTGSRCAAAGGFSLHANVAVPARDRKRLERLARYMARPPLATDRLEEMPDGRLLYRLRHVWRDGTAEIVFSPEELLQRLVPLVPAPGAHLVRYHGVLAPCASWRDRVVPGFLSRNLVGRAPCEGPRPPTSGSDADGPDDHESRPEPAVPGRRYAWADLMRRVFALDVLACPECGGRLRILAAIHPPDTTRAILDCLRVPSRPPPLAPPICGRME